MQTATEDIETLVYFECGVCTTKNMVEETSGHKHTDSVSFCCRVCRCENRVVIEKATKRG